MDNDSDDYKGPGRPPTYRREMCLQARKLCKLGATDLQLADFFEVSLGTIRRWRVEHEEFRDSTKLGKVVADQEVERSLYQRAKGYSVESVKIMTVSVGGGCSEIREVMHIEHYPPDPTSMIFWLKNRKPKDWRDKIEQESAGEITVRVEGGLPKLGPPEDEKPD